MADRLDRKLDPRPIPPSIVRPFPAGNGRTSRFDAIRPLWRAPVPFLSEPKLKHFKNRRPAQWTLVLLDQNALE